MVSVSWPSALNCNPGALVSPHSMRVLRRLCPTTPLVPNYLLSYSLQSCHIHPPPNPGIYIVYTSIHSTIFSSI